MGKDQRAFLPAGVDCMDNDRVDICGELGKRIFETRNEMSEAALIVVCLMPILLMIFLSALFMYYDEVLRKRK